MSAEALNNLFFKTAVHQCNDLVVITDHKAFIEYVNPAFESHTGYQLDEIKGNNISLIKSGVHTTQFYRNLWKTLKRGEPISAIFINKKKNGELYYEHKTITPIRNQGDKITHYLSTSKDISREFTLQKEIVKQKNLVQNVIQNTDALILGLNDKGQIMLFNRACELLTGFKSDEVLGKSFINTLTAKGERNKIKGIFLKFNVKSNKHSKHESFLISKSGEKIPVTWSNTRINGERENDFLILSTGINVSRERSHENKLIHLNHTLDKKVLQRTKKLKELNEEVVLKNKFIHKINSGLPALIYLMNLSTGKLQLLNKNLGNRIIFPSGKNDQISVRHFLSHFNTIEGKKIKKEDFFIHFPTNEYNLSILGKKYHVQNKTAAFELRSNGTPKVILGFITDITETKTIQNRLEESQYIAHVGNWEFDMKANRFYWSPEIFRIFCKDPSKLKPSYSKFLKMIYPADRKKFSEQLEHALENKESYEIEYRIEPIPGVIKYVVGKGLAEYDKNGQACRLLGTVQDITETKNIKQRFDESQKLAKIGTWDWNIKADKFYWSDEMYRIFDVDPKTFYVCLDNLRKFVYPEDLELVKKTSLNARKKKEEYSMVYRIITGKGKFKYLNEKGCTQYSSNGEVIRMLGTVQDVTEEKLLKNELQGAFMTLQTSLNAVFTSDLNGNLQFANNAAVRMWGFSDFETMARARPLVFEYWSPVEQQKVIKCMETIYMKGSYSPAEPYIAIKRNGEEMLVKFNGALIRNENGQPYAMTGSFFDVTEEVRMKREMEEYDKKLNLLLGNIDEVVYGIEASDGCQLDGKIFFLSGKAKHIFGFNLEDTRKNPDIWRQCLHPEDNEILVNSAFQAVNEKRTVTREYRMKHAISGQYAWFEDKVTPQFDSEGKLIAYFGSSRDITEKTKINDRLKESEEKYRLISENNRDLITLRDATIKPLFVSNSVKQMLGYTPEEFSNIDLFDLMHPDDIKNKKQVAEYLTRKERGVGEGRIRHKNGHYIWLQTFTEPVLDSKGNIIQVVSSSRDITERKVLELNILGSEKKYKSIFENALVGIFRTNATTKKLIDANDVCIKLFGYDTKEDFLENFNAAERYEDPKARNILFQDLHKRRSIKNIEIKFIRKDRSVFWGDTSVKLLSEEGVIEGVIVDITQSKIHEMEIKKSLVEKDLLLKELHHRVKNNLQVISSLIKLQLGKIADPNIRGPLLESKDRIHAIALIHEKLYLSEDVATLNFSEYLLNLTRPLKTLYSDKDINVHFNLEPFHTNINIAVPLGLVCHEIISNSFKHAFQTEKKGEIYLSVVKNNKVKEIIIADTGCGFTPADIDATKSLGWSLINNLSKQAKAKLEIRSEPGLGSVFVLNLSHEI